jgi:hypothetical protein
MKTIAIPLFVAFNVAGGFAFAQGADDPMEHLRACSVMDGQARLKCLEDLSRKIGPSAGAEPRGDNWVVSETTSPVDYTPIVSASTVSRSGSDGSSMQLSIHCRGGRTELVVSGPAVHSGEAYAISYRINDTQPVQLAPGSLPFGTGIAFTGDIVRLLQSLPEEGGIAVRLLTRSGAARNGYFLLDGLKMVREKVAAACKWPVAVAKPRN